MSPKDKPDDSELVHLVSSYPNDFDDSDEDEAFYAPDEGDFLFSAKWRARIRNVAQRIPRRVQRFSAVGVLVLFFVWLTLLRPYFSDMSKEYREMEADPRDRFGLNKRPEFDDIVQVKQLDTKYLPKGDAKLFVVGDVHGCKKELLELLEKGGYKEQRDHLILTGDIVSKGPDSPGVVALASGLHASCVRGNHEDRVLLSIAAASATPAPSFSDAKTRKLAKSLTPSQISYLQTCPVILDVGFIGSLEHVAVVHAGLVPDISLAAQDPYQVMNMRTMNMRTRVPSERHEGTPWTKFWNHYQTKKKGEGERWSVIYGHDKKRGFTVKEWSYGLDSGCVDGGKLTAMVINETGEHEFVHVKCPNEGYID
ncbi:unnamed protein product [Periconia digitata]|uniref:Calcineurin-like phosphoesterase domain-containing protein n=1 Tax=Periconia digitata TaxID=1303443 RepID=A0A9W4UK28_9PLEO|nr:unnamed protein product [Periconia digitata]